jgi:leucyl aminopeptidase (aminopeptidase T)
MTDSRTERLAQAMVTYCIDVQPGQQIGLCGSPESKPMLRAL